MSENIQWENYKLHVDLYRSYLDLALKLNLFYYAITGAILSFYFSHQTDPLIRYSLILPLVMSIAFAGFFAYGAKLNNVTREAIDNMSTALNLPIAPEVRVLSVYLWIFVILFLIVALSLAFMIICPPRG